MRFDLMDVSSDAIMSALYESQLDREDNEFAGRDLSDIIDNEYDRRMDKYND